MTKSFLATSLSVVATLFVAATLSAPYEVVYVGASDLDPGGSFLFSNVIGGENYQVTLVMDNGGTSAASQIWTAADLISVRFDFNNAGNATFAQDINTQFNYLVEGSAVTDVGGNLSGFFERIQSGGATFQTNLDGFIGPAEWYINDVNPLLLYAGGSDQGVFNYGGVVSLEPADWTISGVPAAATPVSTLPLIGLGTLVSLLGLFGLRKLRP